MSENQTSNTDHSLSKGLLCDWDIDWLANSAVPMISPYEDKQIKKVDDESVISYGLSSFGYDARLAPEYKIFSNVDGGVVNPKQFSPTHFADRMGKTCIIPPNGFVLARTMEYFRIPKDVLALCLGKSTYARVGVVVNCTPLEPGWEGHVTLELSNTTPLPVRVFAYEGICQFIFLRGESSPLVNYATRNGKYQGQTGITLARMAE